MDSQISTENCLLGDAASIFTWEPKSSFNPIPFPIVVLPLYPTHPHSPGQLSSRQFQRPLSLYGAYSPNLDLWLQLRQHHYNASFLELFTQMTCKLASNIFSCVDTVTDFIATGLRDLWDFSIEGAKVCIDTVETRLRQWNVHEKGEKAANAIIDFFKRLWAKVKCSCSDSVRRGSTSSQGCKSRDGGVQSKKGLESTSSSERDEVIREGVLCASCNRETLSHRGTSWVPSLNEFARWDFDVQLMFTVLVALLMMICKDLVVSFFNRKSNKVVLTPYSNLSTSSSANLSPLSSIDDKQLKRKRKEKKRKEKKELQHVREAARDEDGIYFSCRRHH